MAIFTKDRLDILINEITGTRDRIAKVYLLVGERFLCRQAAARICEALLADGGILHAIDGDQEDFVTTLGKLRSFSLLPGRQVYRVSDTKLFLSQKVAHSLWGRAARARNDNDLVKAGRYLGAMLAAAGLDAGEPANDPGSLPAARWKKLFGFERPPGDLSWTKGVSATAVGKGKEPAAAGPGDPARLLEKTLESGLPEPNILVLLAEDIDKRKRLYKLLKDQYVVVDLSVDTGSSARAQKAQKSVLRELIDKTLADFAKTMAPGVADLLLERVGFHPVAAVTETEKLALFAGTRRQISRDDIDALVGQTRQEVLFELTGALGKRNLERALLVAGRLQDNGIHPLAVVATLRNYARTLLLFRVLQQQPQFEYSRSVSFPVFQRQCLPRLKERQIWQKELSGHPYAVYMQFQTAAAFSPAVLKNWLQLLLGAERRLKGSPLAPATVLRHLIISMLTK